MIRLVLVLVSAGLYALAFPPWDITLLAWVALIPLLVAVRGLALWRSALLGLVWGTVMIHAIGHWVPIAIAVYWEQPLWFGFAFSISAGIVFIGAYGAGFAACATWVSARCRGVVRATVLAALWVTWEVARGRVLTGDPWLLIGYALSPYPTMIQIADLGGVYLVSFVVAFANAALAEWSDAIRVSSSGVVNRVPRATHASPLLVAAILVCGVYAYGRYRILHALPDGPSVRIAVVQGNNALGSQWKQEYYGRGLETYLALSRAAARDSRPQMFIWPESAVTFFLAREPHYGAVIQQLLSDVDADLIVGGPHIEDADPARPHYFNSAFYVTPAAGLTQRYDKAHLMPFGEYFPLRTIEFLRRRFERVRYFTPGDGTTLLDTRLGKTAVVICFEAMFPELVRARMNAGAEVLVNLSNDAWLGDDAGPKQHASMVVFRAVENRTWVVRSTTTGVSTVIDPYGVVRQQTALLAPGVLHASVVPLRIETPYERHGDVFAHGCVALSVLAISFLVTRVIARR
jgi:apolipoprotein N-acyltransferase